MKDLPLIGIPSHTEPCFLVSHGYCSLIEEQNHPTSFRDVFRRELQDFPLGKIKEA